MMQSQNYSLCYLGSGAGKLVMHILSKKIVASHELTLSSSCLIRAERLDNLFNHQIKSKMNLKRRTWKLWEHEVQVTVESWYMASCITDRMHWLICLKNESCFPWKLCTPKTQLVTYCKHTAQYWSQKPWKSTWKSICSNCVYVPNFRQTEHLGAFRLRTSHNSLRAQDLNQMVRSPNQGIFCGLQIFSSTLALSVLGFNPIQYGLFLKHYGMGGGHYGPPL